MFRRTTRVQLAFALALGWAAPLSAQIVEAQTIGEDNLADPAYYRVSFLSGGPAGSFIESISFDISADIDGNFDLDGVNNFANAFEPVVELSSLVGLTAGDITWSFSGTNPNVITANFAQGSFGVGDGFRFGCETDLFVADPCKGGNFSTGGAIFSVKLDHGPTATATFALINVEVAVATADFSNCEIGLSLPVRKVAPGEALTVDIGVFHKPDWVAQTPINAWMFDPEGQVLTTWQSQEFVLTSGTSAQVSHRFVIPPGTPPGIYEIGAGIGQMRQGLILRTMEFEVTAAPPAPAPAPKKKAKK